MKRAERILAEQERAFAPVAAELRAHALARAQAADFADFADRVLAQVRAERPAPLWEKARVWLGEAFTFHPVRMAVAAAAALLLLLGGPVALHAPRAEGGPASVSELDFGPRGGMVFQAPDNTTILWIGSTEGT